MSTKVVNCADCGAKVVASIKATNIERCKECAKRRTLMRRRMARKIGRVKSRPGAPTKQEKADFKKRGKVCTCCKKKKVFPALTYLCYECWENWGDNIVNDGDSEEVYRHLVKLTKIEQQIRERLTRRATILTTSLGTLDQYPNAIMVSQRYAQHYVAHKSVNYFPMEG
jgi:DNA-directed RNA polymerase subunit RPC12/RpoP